jgi:hypothetical protein
LPLSPPLAAGFARLGFGSLPLDRLKARYASAESGSRFIELDGFNVHYRDEGSHDKPALVLIHGVVASLHTWDGWVEASPCITGSSASTCLASASPGPSVAATTPPNG